MGWRTFRIINEGDTLMPREIICPNVTKGVQCKDCLLCSGTSLKAKNIAIPVHGSNKNKFNPKLIDSTKPATQDTIPDSKITVEHKHLLEAAKPPAIILNPSSEISHKPGAINSNNIKRGQIITSEQLMQLEFETLQFEGKWNMFFGNPSINFYLVIYGMPGEGKSTFAIQLAKYLSISFGNVLYISGEEGISKTFKDKMSLTNSVSPSLHIVELGSSNDIIRVVKPDNYRFIFIDSLQHLNIDAAEMKKLRAVFKNSAFIAISQATKAGEMRGSNEILHDTDTVVKVEDGLAITTKNRFKPKGTTFDVFEDISDSTATVKTQEESGEKKSTVSVDSLVSDDTTNVEFIEADKPMNLEELELLLTEVLAKEDFEAAAKLRDIITKMKNK